MKKISFLFFILFFVSASFAAEITSLWPLPSELATFDKNKDNLIKASEITPELSRFDLNNDNIITPSEAIFVLSADKFKKENPNYVEPRFEYPALKKSESFEDTAFKNTILISVDGFDRAVIKELLDANKLPAFRQVARTASASDFVVNITLTGHKTATKPGHAIMLTGLIPEFTRVQTNKKFQPIPEGLTIFERIKNNNPKIKTIFVSSKADNVGAMTAAELGNPIENGIKIEGSPYLNAKENIDDFSAIDRNPKEAKEAFISALKKVAKENFFAFLHFNNPDKQGHKYGRKSEQYREIVIEIDLLLKEILEYLKESELIQNTRILITADHGFDPNKKHHDYAPWISLITNDTSLALALSKKNATLFDIPAAILPSFGVDIDSLDPRPFAPKLQMDEFGNWR